MQTARRYQNNTTTAPVDRRRVFGFAPGLRMSMNPQGSNLPGYDIASGQLLIFLPHVTSFLRDGYKAVNHVVKPGAAPDVRLEYDGKAEKSGSYYANAVANKFQNGKVDFGFRRLEMLDDLDYNEQTGEDVADRYFEVVYPALTCEMGLETPNPRGAAGDIINKGQPLPCPTCRKAWLESDECTNAINSSPLNRDKLVALRKTLIDSFDAGLRAAAHFLGKVEAQIQAKNSAKTYQDCDFQHMQMLHKKPAHVEQAEIQAKAADVQGQAIGKAVAEAIQSQAALAEVERLKAEIAALKAGKTEDEPKKRGNPNWQKKETE